MPDTGHIIFTSSERLFMFDIQAVMEGNIGSKNKLQAVYDMLDLHFTHEDQQLIVNTCASDLLAPYSDI